MFWINFHLDLLGWSLGGFALGYLAHWVRTLGKRSK